MQTRRKSLRDSTREFLKLALAALLAGLLLPSPALAEGEGDGEEASRHAALEFANASFDVAVLRPVALVATSVGTCLFAPAALLAAPGGVERIAEALDVFVRVPWEYLVTRPLGEF